MDKDLMLVLVGGLVGLASSLVTAILTHRLDSRRLQAQLEREDVLRREERAREDQLRNDELRRQAALREADMMWRDIERMEEALQRVPSTDRPARERLERQIEDWSRRRRGLLQEQERLTDRDAGPKGPGAQDR